MNITTEKKPKSLFEVTVELSVAELQSYLQKAAVQISGRTEIQGFRKGSAPFDVVKNKVGEMALYQEAGALAIDKTLPEAIKDQDIQTVGQPQIRVNKLAPENPFVYTATFSLLPEVEVGAYSQIEVKQKAVEVKDEEVNKVIDNLREMRASEALADKTVSKDDLVEVDFDVFKDRVAVEGGTGRKYPVVIGKSQMIPGFEEQLIGLKKDQTKEFKLSFPANYPAKNLAGQECDFKVKVLAVYSRTIPELNEDFVKQFGQFKNVDDFKGQVRQNLENEYRRKNETQAEVEMFEKILAVTKFGEIPDLLTDSEVRKMINELKAEVEGRGLKFVDYLRQIKKNESDLMLDFAPEALKRVKLALLVRKVAEQNKITVAAEEIDKESRAYQVRFKGDGQAEKQINTKDFRRYLENLLTNRKVIAYLKSQIIK